MSFPAALRDRPVTGRVFVTVSRKPHDPALSMRALGHQPVRRNGGVPFVAVDVHDLQPGQEITIESGITEGLFKGRLLSTTKVGGRDAVVTEVTGSVYVTGWHQFVINDADRLRYGFLVEE